MNSQWATKEKIVLLSDILEFGDQPESWSTIANDLLRTFQTSPLSSTTVVTTTVAKKEGRYSIQSCKQEYKSLVNRYKREWIEQGSSNRLKLPLAKYIWIQLKAIYQAELTFQLNESRKKLTEFCLRLETVVNVTSPSNELIAPLVTAESSLALSAPHINEQADEHVAATMETMSETSHPVCDIGSIELGHCSVSPEIPATSLLVDDLKDLSAVPPSAIPLHPSDYTQIKQEPGTDPCLTPVAVGSDVRRELSLSPHRKGTASMMSNPLVEQTSVESCSSSSSSCSVHTPFDESTSPSASTPSLASLTGTNVSESLSSSRLTSTTHPDIKTETVKILPSTTTTTTTTPKYHVYFSPKNPASNNPGLTKSKTKRKATDDHKDDNESESIHQGEPSMSIPPSSSADPSKSGGAAPITRRSINTRSVPNSVAEQEEEKTRRFFSMLSENPHSWQSQANAIIQFLLAQKQGYLFEHEITDEIAPKYHQFIRRPIALHTIRKTLESNEYPSKDHFKRDIYLMLYNAMKYNPRFHHVHRSAKHLFQLALPLFNSSAQDIQGQIIRRSSTSVPTVTTDIPAVKRKRMQ